MNPMSILTFLRRHKGRSALLTGLFCLVTLGVYMFAALAWAIFFEPARSNYMLLSRFSIVSPDFWGESDPTVAAHIRTNPDVAQVIPAVGIQIWLPELMGGEANNIFLLALDEADMAGVMDLCGASLIEGDLIQPRTNGVLLSEQVAANLGLQVGDTMLNSIQPELYGNIMAPLEVVGILESDVRLGLLSREFVSSHEQYRSFPSQLLVVAREGREAAVEEFLETQVSSPQTAIWTFGKITESIRMEYQRAYGLALPLVILVSFAITLVVGIINRINLTWRLPEFGILHAIGHAKLWLARRLTMETGALAVAGWGLGIVLSWSLLYVLQISAFTPGGHELRVITLPPFLLVIPIPLMVVGYVLLSVRRTFSRLDSIAIVEQGELSADNSIQASGDQPRTAKNSQSKPLSPWTFHRRHKGRGALVIAAMTLMIMAVVLVIFIFSVTHDAQMTGLGDLKLMSRVSPRAGTRLDPGVVTRLRASPLVERVIPIGPRYGMLSIFIPPFGASANASPYSVYAEDMAYLVALYGLELKEGHLPRPRTNEMVISESLAQNRGLQVGDVVGDPDRPAYPGASPLPTEFVISGIFARPNDPEEENWLSFVSLEFIESHEAFGFTRDRLVAGLIVVPKAGQKAALDDWLESELASDQVNVYTYRGWVAEAQEEARDLIMTIALIESGIALVAAVALAVLNYIFVSQRRAEFGVLHALGYGRLRLVWQTACEIALTTGIAWALSVVLCLLGLVYMQTSMFAPLGLKLDLFNFTPWLFTLPIPAAVLLVTTGTIARTLTRLDPVYIIERLAA